MEMKLLIGWTVAATTLVVAPGRASAQAPASTISRDSGLNGLDKHLRGEGRFGLMPALTVASDAATTGGFEARGDIRVRTVSADVTRASAEASSTHMPSLSDYQYARALDAVDRCRLEVARRRQVVPAAVPAATALLRWTIESSGTVRDAEVIAGEGTDLEVAACAKRVLTGWAFIKPVGGPLIIERTFAFRPIHSGDTAAATADKTKLREHTVAGNIRRGRHRLR